VLQYPLVLFTPRVVAVARVGGVQGTLAAGFAHDRQERTVFLLISCLIRLIPLLYLNREDYFTPKQGLDLIPKPNPNTTRKVIISDDLLVTLLTLVIEWYVFHDEMSIFVISCE
jgi:hypothetical protein